MNKSFTLIELIVICSILAIIIGMFLGGFSSEGGMSTGGHNIRHDGHLLIKSWEGQLIHHPDCECQK